MSRVGKKPILIPSGVEARIEGQTIAIKGPKGELQRKIRPEIKIEIKEGKIILTPQRETKETGAFWGLSRALVFNMVKGVTDGYEKKLQIEGIGYRAAVEQNILVLKLGFSHPVKFEQPEGIKFVVEKNIVSISGFDNELVGQLAAKIRKICPPEPYKGTGIRYQGEIVRRKAGKKVAAAGT